MPRPGSSSTNASGTRGSTRSSSFSATPTRSNSMKPTSKEPAADGHGGAYGVIVEPDTVRLERLVPGPIERVWSYLTDSDKRGQWFAHGDLEPRVGGAFKLTFR